ncbi:PEGA domain-containing protein [Patescibacteria group bacterium]
MSISTLQPLQPLGGKKLKVPIAVFFVAGIILALLLVFFGRDIIDNLRNISGKSALSADVTHGRAEILINGEAAGPTPFDSQEVKPGTNKITVKSQNRQYETTIKFLSNNDEYIHKVGVFRDLGVAELFSSGQDLWFDEDTSGTVLRVISEPTGASVFIDNTEIGKTPFTSSRLSEGDYDLRIERVGYEAQKARIRIQKGYTSNISVKLFPMPVPSRVSVFEGSDNLYDISSDNAQIISDPNTWVKAVVYWNQTRGVNLEGVGLNKELVFNYYIDFQGNLYNNLGLKMEDPSKIAGLIETNRGAYLGRISDGAGLTEPAKETWQAVTGSKIEDVTNMAKILQTGTGWLRVRSEPSLNSSEIAKADVGKEYALLEEQPEWVKIALSEDLQGWVSKTYVEIVDAEAKTEKTPPVIEEEKPTKPVSNTTDTTPIVKPN